MGDVLLVACGGGAKSTVSNAEDLWSIPMVELSKSEGTIALDDLEMLRKSMRNYRVVIPFLIMGGEVGTAIIRDVISCARQEDCRIVSVLGIPMQMEPDRRDRAIHNLSDVVAMSDCSLVFDMQKAMDLSMKAYGDRKFDFFLRMIDRVIMFSIHSIIECLEGPFFTVFKERLYAFASSNDILLENAVKGAWDTMLFDDNSAKGDSIVMVSSNITTAEVDDLRNMMAREYGVMPEVLRRSDSESAKAIVFRAMSSF